MAGIVLAVVLALMLATILLGIRKRATPQPQPPLHPSVLTISLNKTSSLIAKPFPATPRIEINTPLTSASQLGAIIFACTATRSL